MISYDQARQIIAATATRLPPERVSLADAAGRVLAQSVTSVHAVPQFDNAAMDGFAMRAATIAQARPDAPVPLTVAGTILAGASPPAATPPGAAWEITTGAPVPRDCDAVVPLERIQRAGSDAGTIHVSAAVPAGANIRRAGEDFAAGETVLQPGAALAPHCVMALAAVRQDHVEVVRRPAVAIICTGNELASGSGPLPPGMVPDVNGPYLASMLRRLDVPLASQARVADDRERVGAALRSAAASADMILTTGGVSAGRADFLPAAVRDVGGEILFHHVAIRPGKPVLFARLPGGTLVFGLPGNPIAVAACFRFLVLPALRGLQGRAPESYLAARCREPLNKRSALTFFAKARAEVGTDAVLEATLLPGQESFKIKPLIDANCWAILREGLEGTSAAQTIEVAPLYPTGFLQPPSAPESQ